MKNILLAIDARSLDKKSLAFSYYLAKLSQSPLTGLFLGYVEAEEQPGVKFAYGGAYVETIDTLNSSEKQYKESVCEQNIAAFKSKCQEQGLACHVVRDTEVPMESVLTESRYADLLIVEPGLFSTSPLDSPSGFVKDLLGEAECPVIIAPYQSEDIREIVFLMTVRPLLYSRSNNLPIFSLNLAIERSRLRKLRRKEILIQRIRKKYTTI